jgi:L-malate glycosyltransferase
VIYNGIDLAAFAGAAERSVVRQEFGVADEEFVILQVARLDPLKDHVTALRTLERVVQQRPDARLLVAGEGPELPTIQAAVAHLGLQRQVRLLGLRTDVPRLLAAADLFLLTSVSEGIPLTVIEAMAAGLPVVATPVGAIAVAIEDGKSGLLVPVRDAGALEAALRRLIEDAALRQALGAAARARVESVFAFEAVVARLAAIYDELLAAAD